jgi:hypothetical protein
MPCNFQSRPLRHSRTRKASKVYDIPRARAGCATDKVAIRALGPL